MKNSAATLDRDREVTRNAQPGLFPPASVLVHLVSVKNLSSQRIASFNS
jgi:hypothetical protein